MIHQLDPPTKPSHPGRLFSCKEHDMKPKPNRLSANWLSRRKIAVFKGDFFWFAMDGRHDQNEHNDRGFKTHAEAVEYAFRLAQTGEPTA